MRQSADACGKDIEYTRMEVFVAKNEAPNILTCSFATFRLTLQGEAAIIPVRVWAFPQFRVGG